MNTIIDADAAKLAGLQIDTLHKLRNGQLTIAHWEWFNNLTKDDRDKFSGNGKEKDILRLISGGKKVTIPTC